VYPNQDTLFSLYLIAVMLVEQLLERYELKNKPALYKRLTVLNVTLSKDDAGRSFATPSQLALLDEYDAHLKAGGNKNNFIPSSKVSVLESQKDNTDDIKQLSEDINNNSVNVQSLTTPVVEQLSLFSTEQLSNFIESQTNKNNLNTKVLEHQLNEMKVRSHIQNLLDLKVAAENEFLLTTNQVKDLIGVKPHGQEFVRGNFTFIRSGKIGISTAWKVIKA
jgi:hypothetical protein